jgi:hypothetical protein
MIKLTTIFIPLLAAFSVQANEPTTPSPSTTTSTTTASPTPIPTHSVDPEIRQYVLQSMRDDLSSDTKRCWIDTGISALFTIFDGGRAVYFKQAKEHRALYVWAPCMECIRTWFQGLDGIGEVYELAQQDE